MLEVRVTAQRISNIVPSRSVHPIEVETLQVLTPTGLTPRQDWLSLQKGVWSVICDQVELLTKQKVASKNTQSFNRSKQLLLSDDIVVLSRSHLPRVVPERASFLEQDSS